MSHRPTPGRRAVLRGSLMASAALTLPTTLGAAPAFARSGRPRARWGVQTGDVTRNSGLVWVRSDRPARMIVETSATESFRHPRRWHGPLLGPGTDFTGTTRLRGLPPGEQIHYRVTLTDPDDPRRTGEPVTGTFRTAPARRRDGVRFLWSGDLAGQGWGINPGIGGYRPGDSAVAAGGADRRDGLVHALRLGYQDHTGVDEGRRRQRRPLPGVPPPAPRGRAGRRTLWPEHGIPRSVLIDVTALEGPMRSAASPALVPATVLVDHGKVFVSEHLTSVCRRLGISVRPARLRMGRDKGPLERFFLTLREDLLQGLPGYKGPDLHSRGERPKGKAFFFLHELEAIIREWVACVYHHRPHTSLVDPGVPGLRMSPAAMFEHGLRPASHSE